MKSLGSMGSRNAPWQAKMLVGIVIFFCVYQVIMPSSGFIQDAIKVTLGALVGFITGSQHQSET